MAKHRDAISVEGVSHADEALDRLHAFFEANGYERVELSPLIYERGQQGAGWWSSQMDRLHARYIVTHDEEAQRLNVSQDVDLTGQHMTTKDLAFWRAELEALSEHAAQERAPTDLRIQEAQRARQGRSETVRLSVYGFFITFTLLFILLVLLQRMGLLVL